jgi:hypothetical protein
LLCARRSATESPEESEEQPVYAKELLPPSPVQVPIPSVAIVSSNRLPIGFFSPLFFFLFFLFSSGAKGKNFSVLYPQRHVSYVKEDTDVKKGFVDCSSRGCKPIGQELS